MSTRLYPTNPQAMAALNGEKKYTGHQDLGRHVNPDTWLTPRWILEQLGEFDLDPCAAAGNPTWVAPKFYTGQHLDDGLEDHWFGRVFMNPPFSNTAPWIRKHSEHLNGISLVPASIESRIWRQCVWTRANGILLLHGRTRFCNPDGSSTNGRPLRSIALIAWSAEDLQILACAPFAGILLTTWRHQ